MFSDLVGSTALSACMDPEDLREVISAYRKSVAETVRRFGGFVAKYMGDGVLAYFGYPEAHEDDAEGAVRAGLELIGAVTVLKAPVSLQTRVGIATGLVVVGDLLFSRGLLCAPSQFHEALAPPLLDLVPDDPIEPCLGIGDLSAALVPTIKRGEEDVLDQVAAEPSRDPVPVKRSPDARKVLPHRGLGPAALVEAEFQGGRWREGEAHHGVCRFGRSVLRRNRSS